MTEQELEEAAARLVAERATQGLEEHVTDAGVIARVVAALRQDRCEPGGDVR